MAYMQQQQWYQQYMQWYLQQYPGAAAAAGYNASSGMAGWGEMSGWPAADQTDSSAADRSGRFTPRRYMTAHTVISLDLAGIIMEVRRRQSFPKRLWFHV